MFFTPRYLKEAKQYLQAANKLRNYRRDLFKPEELATLNAAIDALKSAMRERSREAVGTAIKSLDTLLGELAPPPSDAGWREQVEVFLVAIVIAAGVRAYFLQPFRIPTGSMQPTLYGVVGEPSNDPAPNPLFRLFELVVQGRNWIDVTAKDDDIVLTDPVEKTYLNFFIFSTIECEKETYRVFSPKAPLMNEFGVRRGTKYQKGQPIARGYVNTGDQVFVDKMSYHFRRPQRADVFVFKTTGIRLIQQQLPRGIESQYYIKRLAGVSGDLLRIDAPRLFINGSVPLNRPFQNVMSMENGYFGYSNQLINGLVAPILGSPDETFKVRPNSYFALGDNSYNSFDSRFWGIVPEQNVAGRGFFVYWPFTKRWGLIH